MTRTFPLLQVTVSTRAGSDPNEIDDVNALHRDGKTFVEIGRRLEVGGNRARQLVAQAERAEKRTARLQEPKP